MITFILICAAMLVASLLLIARPLWKEGGAARIALPISIVLVSAASVTIYWLVGHRTWEQDEAATAAQVAMQREFAASLAKLERHVRENPNDVAGLLNLGEALIAQDERSIVGRAGELFEAAVVRAPDNTKALFYSAIAALSTGRIPVGRERLEKILAQNPPVQVRNVIERQLEQIDKQTKAQQQQAANSPSLNVQVTLAPSLSKTVDKGTALFVLARDPSQGGPPLAAVRRTVGELPLTLTLSDNDAMIQGRGISSVARVQVVARISKTGTPIEQAGDLVGDATIDLAGAQPIAVKIAIDRKVEK